MGDVLKDRQAAALRALQQRFRATIANTLDAFRQLAAQLAVTPQSPDLLDALRRELHRVHGTAGSYGFAEASRLAGEAEARAVAWSGDDTLEVSTRSEVVRTFLAALEIAFQPKDAGEGAGDATHPGRPTIVTIALGAAPRQAIAADADRRGLQHRALTLEQAQLAILRDIAPVLVAVPIEHASAIADVARELGIPIAALDDRATITGDAGVSTSPGVTAVDVRDGYAAVIDLAERTIARTAGGGVTILALDDDPSILAMVAFVLEGPGVSVRTIDDVTALPAALETFLPSLLLCDIDMPGATGIELTRALRGDSRYRDLPIVLLSSETDAGSRDAALRAGADEFVSKPIASAELRHRVADRLERHRLDRVAAGLHAVTGMPAGARAARESAAAFQQLADADGTVVVLRSLSGEDDAQWHREVARIGRGVDDAAVFVGHLDGASMLAILSVDSVAAASRLTSLAHAARSDAPRWHAGMVERADLQRGDLALARRFADDAADVARLAGDEVVHRWQRDEALVAPDVVVVEDDPALSDMLQYALRASGFTYRAFSNGRVALEYLLTARTQGRRPIVLLDVDLPGLDGYSLHERLSVERAGEFSVVFVTVHGAESDQLRALKGGAIDFVLKPLNLRILMAKMASWAAASRPIVSRP